MESIAEPQTHFEFLSELLLSVPRFSEAGRKTFEPELALRPSNKLADVASHLGAQNLEALRPLATSNHVIVRAFRQLRPTLAARGNHDAAQCAGSALQAERLRIEHALQYLHTICAVLDQNGCPVAVIKSLDHWPDLGSDLDLYTDAEASKIVQVMSSQFGAKLAERSWGDRLANKWNFIVPGLPEMVEVHVGRLGQTGEQVAITDSLVKKSRHAEFAGYTLRVPAPEDRLMISTLQRMYRHFYLRLCDVADTARLVESGTINYVYLRSLARSAGLWDGLATYMVTVAGYVKSTSGRDLPLPELVTKSAQFGSELVHFRRKFLRIPIFPQAAKLYAAEWRRLLLNGELQNTFRLSLLPGLAAAAALEFKLTGSDKGIW